MMNPNVAARPMEMLTALAAALDEHAIVSIADAAGNIRHVNEKFCQVSGYAREELLGRNHRIVKSDFHPPGFFELMWQTISAGKVWQGEVCNRRRDGRHYWVETTIVPFLDADGLPEQYISVRTEITRVMELEEALREANEFLLVRIGERTAELEEAKARLEAELQRREQDQATLQRNYEQLRRLHDQLQATQQQLMQSERLAAVGQLAAGMAHEINNPIGFVFANVGTLGRYFEQLFHVIDQLGHVLQAVGEQARHPETRASCHGVREGMQRLEADIDLDYLRQDGRALLAETLDGIGRVQRIVQSLRDFSRVDSDAAAWLPGDLHGCLENALSLLAGPLREGIEVHREYADLPEIVYQPAQLNQAFMNLLSNALQAMSGQGRLTLRSGRDAARVWIEVDDTGHGIAAEVMPHIFEPFYTTRDVGQGTGLGLSLAYGIVRQHGGTIEVRSAPGQGACFRVVLPISPPHEAGVDA